MFSLELLQNVHLPLLVASQPAHLLLPLIVHHFLDHGPRLAIQITQTRVLRRDFAHINLRRRRHNVSPPFHLIDLVQMNRDLLSGRLGRRLQRPGRFIHDNRMRKVALLPSC